MKTRCPQCGAEIEFRFDDSFVRVCASCRSAVARTDRGIETLGKIADLAPLDSPLALFAEGTYGNQSFILIGKAQVRHAAGGLWQEWYAKLGGGVWGWLAEAQGRYYMTFEVPGVAVPPHYQLAPGAQVTLPTHAGPRVFTVAELGVATYTAADGELPFRLTPEARFRYADLTDGQGGFATIDYGPPHQSGMPAQSEQPSVYVGAQIPLAALRMVGGEVAPAAAPFIASQRLACPNCGGSLELRAPDVSLRVVCPFCNTMLDVGAGGVLSVLQRLTDRTKPAIELGRKVTFGEGELQVIGFLRRAAHIEGEWYPFDEYLLHSRALGFRWLVCSDGHWSYVQPVTPGACTLDHTGANYQGVKFAPFQTAELRIVHVLGELYWQAKVGDSSFGRDFIAPPAMLSCEEERREINWSLSTYLSRDEVRKAVGDFELPRPEGVAPNQPWKHTGVGKWYGLMLVALVVAGVVLTIGSRSADVATFRLEVPRGKPERPAEAPPEADPGHVVFSDPFELRGGENVEISLSASVDNSWVYLVTDLVDEDKGSFVTFDSNIEYYHGYDADEGWWNEGSTRKVQTLAPMPAGTYVLRIEAQSPLPPGYSLSADSGTPPPLLLTAMIRQDVFQSGLWGLAFVVLLLPGVYFFLSKRGFEKRRMENSSFAGRPRDDGDDDDDDDFDSGDDE